MNILDKVDGEKASPFDLSKYTYRVLEYFDGDIITLYKSDHETLLKVWLDQEDDQMLLGIYPVVAEFETVYDLLQRHGTETKYLCCSLYSMKHIHIEDLEGNAKVVEVASMPASLLFTKPAPLDYILGKNIEYAAMTACKLGLSCDIVQPGALPSDKIGLLVEAERVVDYIPTSTPSS